MWFTQNHNQCFVYSNLISSDCLVFSFKSTEDYVYVRGRGRGKYICEECGIRCKKPSMLKKHIRTHTDIRPYECKSCHFAFKTKGKFFIIGRFILFVWEKNGLIALPNIFRKPHQTHEVQSTYEEMSGAWGILHISRQCR